MTKVKAGIIGATGYTGSELVRILHFHPHVDIEIITSESKAGEKFSDIHKAFTGIVEDELQLISKIREKKLDLVFLALPHGVAMNFIKDHYDKPFKIIDLSGDFRLSNANVYEEWYGTNHIFPEGFESAVFGLPELFRSAIKDAKLVSNPGCYPTSAILGIYPLLKNKQIDPTEIIVDSKSGTTGAGIKPKSVTHFSNVNDNFKPYGLKSHRHTIEIQETLQVTDKEVMVQFTPHLLPIDRGIISTIYLKPKNSLNDKDIINMFREEYHDDPFVRLRNQIPSVKDIKASNYCDIYATFDDRTKRIIVVTAIDNLVKGAAGQAVQNMNIMFGISETEGLQMIPVTP